MKHSRPCQHHRVIKTKRGLKRITINPGIVKKRRNYGSSFFRKVYLPKQKIFIDNSDQHGHKVIGELFRKNPELIKLKGEGAIGITTDDLPHNGEFTTFDDNSKLIRLNKELLKTNRPLQQYSITKKMIAEESGLDVNNPAVINLATKYVNSHPPFKGKNSSLLSTLAHELTHAKQLDKYGSLENMNRNYSVPIVGTFSRDQPENNIQSESFKTYQDNPLEVEARKVGDSFSRGDTRKESSSEEHKKLGMVKFRQLFGEEK